MKNRYFQVIVMLSLLLYQLNTFASETIFVNWPEFMKNQDMVWDYIPKKWQEAPHFGNASIGSMLYTKDGSIRLQVFRMDVHDHRDNSFGWTAYSRPKLNIGDFYLKPVGKLTGCSLRKDLWNAELTGTITTDKGTIKIRHFVHAINMAIITEIEVTGEESGCSWSWVPVKAETTRGGYPKKKEDIADFAKRYGGHYSKTLKLYKLNPEGQLIKEGSVNCWKQDFLASGQYATAWIQLSSAESKFTHIVSITNSYPEKTAASEAINNVRHFSKANMPEWTGKHRDWWHNYYPRSFVDLPDKPLEALYWQTIYRLACNSRIGRNYIDTAGMWLQGGSWPYTTNDHNTQVAHWPVYTANRLELGKELVNSLHKNMNNLINSVRPVEWQSDSAFLHVTTAHDFYGPRDQDMRYWDLVGCLPWTMHNCWMQYRYSMDDQMLREKIYPLLKRSINMYLHLLKEDSSGKFRLPPTYSPETGTFEDCNFDLALLRWGCQTLLKASERLQIDDPLESRWQDVLDRLVDYPVDEFGYRLGSNKTSPTNHRHGSHFIMAYPLMTENIEQPDTHQVLQATLKRFMQGKGYPGMRVSYSGPLAAVIGDGQTALEELKVLQSDLHPNGLWYSSPCLEVSLSVATVIQDMLLQSWGDKIRVFPATPKEWQDVTFKDLRTEGAFLISASRKNGKTEWVTVKSLAGEPCRITPAIEGSIKTNNTVKLRLLKDGVYELKLKKGQQITLSPASSK